VAVRTYGQYCPIARAWELLAERWSFIILRNIVLIGCRTFNEIARPEAGNHLRLSAADSMGSSPTPGRPW
jgi:hypothetical protein